MNNLVLQVILTAIIIIAALVFVITLVPRFKFREETNSMKLADRVRKSRKQKTKKDGFEDFDSELGEETLDSIYEEEEQPPRRKPKRVEEPARRVPPRRKANRSEDDEYEEQSFEEQTDMDFFTEELEPSDAFEGSFEDTFDDTFEDSFDDSFDDSFAEQPVSKPEPVSEPEPVRKPVSRKKQVQDEDFDPLTAALRQASEERNNKLKETPAKQPTERSVKQPTEQLVEQTLEQKLEDRLKSLEEKEKEILQLQKQLQQQSQQQTVSINAQSNSASTSILVEEGKSVVTESHISKFWTSLQGLDTKFTEFREGKFNGHLEQDFTIEYAPDCTNEVILNSDKSFTLPLSKVFINGIEAHWNSRNEILISESDVVEVDCRLSMILPMGCKIQCFVPEASKTKFGISVINDTFDRGDAVVGVTFKLKGISNDAYLARYQDVVRCRILT